PSRASSPSTSIVVICLLRRGVALRGLFRVRRRFSVGVLVAGILVTAFVAVGLVATAPRRFRTRAVVGPRAELRCGLALGVGLLLAVVERRVVLTTLDGDGV